MEEPELVSGRAERLEVVQEVLAGTLEVRFEYAARLASRFGNDRESVVEELDLWQSWLRDVLLLKEGADDLVVNVSIIELLRSTSSTLSADQIAGAARTVEETVDLLSKNVNPRLALEQLMLKLPRL